MCITQMKFLSGLPDRFVLLNVSIVLWLLVWNPFHFLFPDIGVAKIYLEMSISCLWKTTSDWSRSISGLCTCNAFLLQVLHWWRSWRWPSIILMPNSRSTSISGFDHSDQIQSATRLVSLCLIGLLAFICPSVKPPRDNQVGINIDILEGTKLFDLRVAFNFRLISLSHYFLLVIPQRRFVQANLNSLFCVLNAYPGWNWTARPWDCRCRVDNMKIMKKNHVFKVHL